MGFRSHNLEFKQLKPGEGEMATTSYCLLALVFFVELLAHAWIHKFPFSKTGTRETLATEPSIS